MNIFKHGKMSYSCPSKRFIITKEHYKTQLRNIFFYGADFENEAEKQKAINFVLQNGALALNLDPDGETLRPDYKNK